MEGIRVSAIMACDPDGLIGVGDRLPWHYPAEQLHFYDVVQGKPLIMGHRTYACSPLRLSHREGNIVFSHVNKPDLLPAGVRFFSSVEDFRAAFATQNILPTSLEMRDMLHAGDPRAVSLITAAATHFMVGGAQIARLFLENRWLDTFILSHIKRRYQGDVWLDLSYLKDWQSLVIEDHEDYTVKLYYVLRF